MNVIDVAIAKWKNINQKLIDNDYIRDIITDVDANTFIVDTNANEQLYEQGVNALGVPIDSYAPYRPYTIRMKQLKNQPYDRVTLRDTGDFERNFRVEVGQTEFIVTSDDWKTEELMEKYGKIFGLTPKNMGKLSQEVVLPDLLLRIRNDLSNG